MVIVKTFVYACVDRIMNGEIKVDVKCRPNGLKVRLAGVDLVGGILLREGGRESSVRGSRKYPALNAPSKRSMCD